MVKLLPVFQLFFVTIVLCNGNPDQNKTFIVTAVLNEPYVMLKESVQPLTGNEQYEGYSIDLMERISQTLGFKYTIQLAPDNNRTGAWDRIVTELLEDRADFAIGDLTITSERERAVDFSTPFMSAGISILFTKPKKTTPSLFAFMDPFSVSVWICIFFAYIGVSVLLYILGRFTPSYLSQQQDKDDSQFSLMSCMFLPRSLSTQLVAGIWWFFVLIMVSMYSANCSAFASVERIEYSIQGVEDLAGQTEIKYGVVKGGSTASFFSNADPGIYENMWLAMKSSGQLGFASNTAEGVNRVIHREGKYAFLMESPAIEYVTERRCELTQVGPLLDYKNYGIAMRKNSPYRSHLNAAILNLQEDGYLQRLKVRWWKEQRGGGSCGFYDNVDDALSLDLDNLGGVFIILIFGLSIACIIAVGECVFKSRKERNN